jgi:DNA-binding transcriptional LysR family regulator
MVLPSLDIELLRSFLAIAEGGSFTSAGVSLGASQSAMSVRIRKLEERLGRRLLERSPRSISLTGFGESFLADARRVLEAHDEAVLKARGREQRPDFSLAVSDHAAGGSLPGVVASLVRRCREVRFLMTVGPSVEIYRAFEDGRYDAVVIRNDPGYAEGRLLFRDRLQWAAAQHFAWRPDDPLPLISLAAPCGVRAAAIAALEACGIAWREVFVGTGVAAVQAAVSAGLGIAPLDSRNLPGDCRMLADDDGLPALPVTELVLHHRARRRDRQAIVAALEATFSEVASGQFRR